MRSRGFLNLFITITICNCIVLHAQAQVNKTHRILILLDASQQMAEQLSDGRTRYNAAADFVSQLIENTYTVNADVEFGLRVYGHQYNLSSNNCNDSRMEVRFSKDNLAQMSLRMHDIKPKGLNNAAYAMQQAFANEMLDTQYYWYSIIWVSGGEAELCKTDICKVIDATPIDDLYKLYNIQLNSRTVKTNNCIEHTLQVTNTIDAANAFATIVPNYKKDKKPEPYWGSFRKRKVEDDYTPALKPKAAAQITQDKYIPVINTIPAVNPDLANEEHEDKITPRSTPPVAEQKRNDSVSILNTLATRNNAFKQFTLARVKAGTIPVPIFTPPQPQPANDTITQLTTLATKDPILNKNAVVIAAGKVSVPIFIPPQPTLVKDTVALMKPISTHVPLLTRPLSTTFAARKTIVPAFTPPAPQSPRDSVASMTSAGTVMPVRKAYVILDIQPKTVVVPSYNAPRQADAINTVSARSPAISLSITPLPRMPKKVAVPAFYAIPLTEIPPPTEQPPEPVTEEIVDADAIPSIVHGNLNIKTFGSTVRVQVFRIKLGEDVLVSDNSMNGPRQLRIKLEPGRYKMLFNLNDGTEVTKPFLIDEETDTDINLK